MRSSLSSGVYLETGK